MLCNCYNSVESRLSIKFASVIMSHNCVCHAIVLDLPKTQDFVEISFFVLTPVEELFTPSILFDFLNAIQSIP